MTLTALIARPQQSSLRVFPAITADFYSSSSVPEAATPDRQAAVNLIALAYRNLTKAQLFFARNLSPQDHLARLLIQHRLGFEAELSAQWQRADFYWQQVQNQLIALRKQGFFWQALADDLARDYPDAEGLKDPITLRQRLVEELLIDTHCGFYNGLNQLQQKAADSSQAGSGCDRNFAHLCFLEALLPQSSLPSESWLAMLALPWQQQIERYRADQNWREAIRLCRHRLSVYPKSIAYQTELAEVEGAAILATLKKRESRQQFRANARCLQKGIRQFETLVKTYPYNCVLYDYLGDLHHLHAIQLGNAGEVAAGLVAVEKALTYAPQLKGALSTRNDLAQLMNQIQDQVAQIKANLKRQPNARLTAQGQQLIAQAKKGFTSRDAYVKSPQVIAIQSSVKLAQAMEVWRTLPGFPPDPTEQQALALYNSLSQILQQPPPDKASLTDDWQRVSRAHPDLAVLPSGPICAFLEQRLWKTGAAIPIVTPPPPIENPVVLPTQLDPQPSHEPLLPWLFSRQNPVLKTQMALAIAALLAAGGLGLYEFSVRTTRARAYAELVTAAQADRPLVVMESAETFLSRSTLSGKDAREAQVKQLYTQAFVSWFLQQPNSPEAATLQRYGQRYRELTAE
ncbi:hypothetical protein [Pseudanabaena sp. FACHB-2040]|uniref:hypothetical protein n=1 Tax=Pseudanabaena sp. FACHB-2040 TaxID=2692859 RepID=UPI001683AAA2|nr:hypothetical protein [Pseudanabaena sp. FACHB-2040]MBD2259302.1 hypothetical protein [Pseudanabaena sp. FACHB-2040]